MEHIHTYQSTEKSSCKRESKQSSLLDSSFLIFSFPLIDSSNDKRNDIDKYEIDYHDIQQSFHVSKKMLNNAMIVSVYRTFSNVLFQLILDFWKEL